MWHFTFTHLSQSTYFTVRSYKSPNNRSPTSVVSPACQHPSFWLLVSGCGLSWEGTWFWRESDSVLMSYLRHQPRDAGDLCGVGKHCVSSRGCEALVYEGSGSLSQMKRPWMGTWLAVFLCQRPSDLAVLVQEILTVDSLSPGLVSHPAVERNVYQCGCLSALLSSWRGSWNSWFSPWTGQCCPNIFCLLTCSCHGLGL